MGKRVERFVSVGGFDMGSTFVTTATIPASGSAEAGEGRVYRLNGSTPRAPRRG
ncbi:MAG: hypothetical protein R3A52_07920 [Polyangiales bacterium]